MKINKNNKNTWNDKIFSDKNLSKIFGGIGVLSALSGMFGICLTDPGSRGFMAAGGLTCLSAASLWFSEKFEKLSYNIKTSKSQSYKL